MEGPLVYSVDIFGQRLVFEMGKFSAGFCLLLGLSLHGSTLPVEPIAMPSTDPVALPSTGLRGSLSDGVKDTVDYPGDCNVTATTLWTQNINWTRLTKRDIGNVVNTSFTIFRCSGSCSHHHPENGQVIKDEYALQMRNLVRSCTDCKELKPCCVAKRYHGEITPTAIRFDYTNVTVVYYEGEVEKKFTHRFLKPKVCHCQ